MTNDDRRPRGVPVKLIDDVRTFLPRGNTLDDRAFAQRHLLLCWMLLLHIPAILALAIVQGFGVPGALIGVAAPAVGLLLARLLRTRRLRSFFATAGLVACSVAIVHLTGGQTEAHFHFFILIGFIALYQDWVPLAWAFVLTALSHGIGSAIDADIIFDHPAAIDRPWIWTYIHVAGVLSACVGAVLLSRYSERETDRALALAEELAHAEVERSSRDAEQQKMVSDLFVNLARRNQSLLNRQLTLIDELESSEADPDALADLFKLDHFATRMRRNAESLLVLSGEEPPRRWGEDVGLGDVVRAAAAEVEDFPRVSVVVEENVSVSGRVVADAAHLLAELIENATSFSPPGQPVTVRYHDVLDASGDCVITIEDRGIGMAADDIAAANEELAQPTDVGVDLSQMLGFHVVARLARRHLIGVRLIETPGGGLTAIVRLPSAIFTRHGDGPDRRPSRSTGPVLVGPAPAPQPPVTAGVAAHGASPTPVIDLRDNPPAATPAERPTSPPSLPVSLSPVPPPGARLEQRVPQTHISPELRTNGNGSNLGNGLSTGSGSDHHSSSHNGHGATNGDVHGRAPGPDGARTRSPEDVRLTMSRFQRQRNQARRDMSSHPPPPPPPPSGEGTDG